jgi:hypothetical protein
VDCTIDIPFSALQPSTSHHIQITPPEHVVSEKLLSSGINVKCLPCQCFSGTQHHFITAKYLFAVEIYGFQQFFMLLLEFFGRLTAWK